MNDSQGVLDFADRESRAVNPTRSTAAAQVSPPVFGGTTYNAEQDEVRLSGQMLAVYGCMSDQQWRTLAEIRALIKCGSEAGISARLRDLRKKTCGQNIVNKRRRGDPSVGIYEYQLIVNPANALRFKCWRVDQ